DEQQAPPMPDMSQMPPEMVEGMARMQANSEAFLAHLLPAVIGHTPDVAALRAAPLRIAVRAGEASGGQIPHLAALALAERRGTTPVSFPGDHRGFATHPPKFAETVHHALRGSYRRRPVIAPPSRLTEYAAEHPRRTRWRTCWSCRRAKDPSADRCLSLQV